MDRLGIFSLLPVDMAIEGMKQMGMFKPKPLAMFIFIELDCTCDTCSILLYESCYIEVVLASSMMANRGIGYMATAFSSLSHGPTNRNILNGIKAHDIGVLHGSL